VIEMLSYGFVQMGVLCVLVLAGIHAYLGHHVVSRGVIFVDLSLAQVAALGSVAAMWMGVEGGPLHYAISLLFTFAGALLISVARTRDERVPQEAFIGIVYAGSTGVSVLLLAHHPEGAEMIQHMLAGSLLTVSSSELARIAVLYAVLGIFFYVLRGRFELISTNRAAAAERGWNLVWWDFLFYAAFAVVVTTAVRIAGVLLVFSLLVIPPVAALLLTTRARARLALGWVFGAAGALGGVLASVVLDLPAGPSVMTALVLLLLAAAAMSALRAARH
jgi:zinc/manganese transport system permease protein